MEGAEVGIEVVGAGDGIDVGDEVGDTVGPGCDIMEALDVGQVSQETGHSSLTNKPSCI